MLFIYPYKFETSLLFYNSSNKKLRLYLVIFWIRIQNIQGNNGKFLWYSSLINDDWNF